MTAGRAMPRGGTSPVPTASARRAFARALLACAFGAALGACGDEADERSPDSVRGAWFYCELERDPNCLVLDDDGFELAANGTVRAIEDTGQGSLPECGDSACLAVTAPQARVERGEELGTWVYGNGTLTLVVRGCAERLRPRVGEPLVAFESCPAPLDDSATERETVRVRRFPGAVEYTNP